LCSINDINDIKQVRPLRHKLSPLRLHLG
jgi:hypothetical protein